MKLIGNLLMTVCLLVGLLAAATSYLAPVKMDEDRWVIGTTEDGDKAYLHVSAPVGATAPSEEDIERLRAQYLRGEITAQKFIAEREKLKPVIKTDEPVTPEALEKLRANTIEIDGKTRKVKYAHIKKFSPMSWPLNWAFALSAIGLFTGSMLVRTATKAEIAAHANAEDKAPHESPDGLLAHIRLSIDKLRSDVEKCSTDAERTHLIVEVVGDLQKKQLADFVDAKTMLIGRMGLGGYAEMMDRFAAAERQINRAWSIAADGFYEQSRESLENAAHILVETQEKM